MVLVAAEAKPAASWEFDADIAILTHATTIQPRYQVIGGGGWAVGWCCAAGSGGLSRAGSVASQAGGPLQLAQVLMLPPSCNASRLLTRHLPPWWPPQAVIHCEIVRQSARVVAMDRERLRCAAAA